MGEIKGEDNEWKGTDIDLDHDDVEKYRMRAKFSLLRFSLKTLVDEYPLI